MGDAERGVEGSCVEFLFYFYSLYIYIMHMLIYMYRT